MSRILPAISVLILAACYPEVPAEFSKTGEVGEDSGGLTDDDPDADGDGVPASEDCDDADASVHPGADELCDGIDNDCDGVVDPDDALDAAVWFADTDSDGFGDAASSSRSCDPPAGSVAVDGDCNDGDSSVHPDATEVCDGIDNDCDALIDDLDDSIDPAALSTFFADTDDDGYGDAATALQACELPSGYVADDTDCNDVDPAIHPAATEICDDLDNDCDGLVDGDDDSVDTSTFRDFYLDNDGDGYGAGTSAASACATPAGMSDNADDCNDLVAAVNPDAMEVCDSHDTDEDCNGLSDDADPGVDTGTATAWTADADGDGYGDSSAAPTLACDDPSTDGDLYVVDATDCDDADAAVNPGATEVCDAGDVDEDCDGLSDDDDASTDPTSMTVWAVDADGDSYGDADSTPLSACEDPSSSTTNYVADTTDCDDADSAVNPGATEVCDEFDVDEDCDGLVDDADPSVDPSTGTTWYVDADADGYGDSSATGTTFCEDPASGHVTTADDCDDGDADVNPGATEICNHVDDDCDAATSQAGMARFEDTSGASTDLSTTLGAGSSSGAVSWSSSGDGTLWICEDTWYVNLEVGGDAVDIIGPDGASVTVLDGTWDGSVLDAYWNADVEMSGFTLQSGYGWDGGGIVVDSSTFSGDSLRISGNDGWDGGGGIASFDSAFTLVDSTIEDNYADVGGGIYIDGDDGSVGVSFDGVTVTTNYAYDKGGGVFIEGDADVSFLDSDLSSNEADGNGGGLYQSNGELSLDTCTVDDNLSGRDGGGAYLRDTVTATDSSFDGNEAADDGGGLYIDIKRNEDVVLSGSIPSGSTASSASVSGNTAGDDGDGIRIKIADQSPSGTLEVDTVDFGTDDVAYDTDGSGTLTPGDGASFVCDHDDDCR